MFWQSKNATQILPSVHRGMRQGQREKPGTSYRPSGSGTSTNRSQYADFKNFLHDSTAEVKEGISNNLNTTEVAGEGNEFAGITEVRYITRLRNDVRVGKVRDSSKNNRSGCISCL
jgi:hypothetical protein